MEDGVSWCESSLFDQFLTGGKRFTFKTVYLGGVKIPETGQYLGLLFFVPNLQKNIMGR